MLIRIFFLLFFVNSVFTEQMCCDDNSTLEYGSDTSLFCYNVQNDTDLSINNENCNTHMLYQQNDIYNYTITDGTLKMFHNGIKILQLENDKFCEGNFTEDNSTELKLAVILCYSPYDDSQNKHLIFSYCMIVSVVFFALTAVVYSSFSELRDLHGKSIISMCSSFGISMLYFIIMDLAPTDLSCAIKSGFFAYFFLVAAFFWMNSICIQILLSIFLRQQHEQSRGWREFVFYSLYSWGMATALTVWLAIANYMPGNHLAPEIGFKTCWIYSNEAQLMYLYSVLLVIIVANICIFVCVSIYLWRYSSTYVKSIKYRLCMVAQLIVVTGVGWIFEVAAALHGEDHIVWFIFNIYNSLQGLMIFLLLVVFRRRAIHAAYKHGWFCCCVDTVEKYLANHEDAEGNTIQHTIIIPLEQRD